NEYTSMTLARLAGVDTPDFWMDDISALDIEGLTGLEGQVFAIRRFDRTPDRVHIEDFAQVLSLRPEQKYGHTNYDTLANVLLNQTGAGVGNLRRFVRRLVVNILIGNGDAHVKNFSLIYPDGRTPELAPAYDVVSTIQ